MAKVERTSRGQRTERPNANADSRAERPSERVPVNGMRDKLTVHGKDPSFHYYWCKDNNEEGQEIFNFLRAGYVFVRADEVKIGQDAVYKTESVGSIIRQPAGFGEWLYLMKQPMDFYLEDQKAEQDRILSRENAMIKKRSPEEIREDEQYNSSTLSSDLR